MSKVIEALKAYGSKEVSAEKMDVPREIQVEKTGREFTQQQLADIYFSATGKPKSLEAPVIIRVVEKPRLASLMPWMISSVAFLIMALSLFSTKKIFIDVKVIDEKNLTALSAAKLQEPEVSRAVPEKNLESAGRPIPLELVTFEGAAPLKSSKDKESLTLINSSVAPFARATLHLDPPLNLSNAKIVFFAKGSHGGENVAIALKDRDNVQGFVRGKIYPFQTGLTTGWQKAEISMNETSKGFDVRNVTSIHFEFGSKDTDNKPGDTLFIRDLQRVPA